jgi:hypothetical protein
MLAIGNKTDRKPLVYFVGLSAKPMCEHLAPETRTGNIIEQIIHDLPSIKAVKTNLVKIPPIDQEGNLRYPNPTEMQSGWNELQDEMNQRFPDLLVTLGQQVSFFYAHKWVFNLRNRNYLQISRTNLIYRNLNLIFSLFITHHLFMSTAEKTSRTMSKMWFYQY